MVRSRTSIRFHPNSRASSDQAPGPTSAKAAPRVANKMVAHGSAGPPELKFQSSRSAITDPATGVHKPARSRIPATTSITLKITWPSGAPAPNRRNPNAIPAIPATSRISSNPTPGQPWANVEKRRRKRPPFQESLIGTMRPSPERVARPLF